MAGKKESPDKTTVPADHSTPALQGQPASPKVSVTTPERLQHLLDSLRKQTTIVDDDDQNRPFKDENKEFFIMYCEQAYPILDRMTRSINEVGVFLYEVRETLKPRGLFNVWLDFIALPRRTAYNYLRLHDTFKEELLSYGYLGVKKLLTASTLKKGAIAFVKQNEEILSRETVSEVEKRIKQVKRGKPKGKGGRKPKYELIDRFKIRISTDGTRIVVENLDKERREKILTAIKRILSQSN